MRLSDFHYELPPDRIAQEPLRPRDAARLLVHGRGADATRHRGVRDLPQELAPGDLLVVNDTRVLPARLHGRRPSGGAVELLLLGPTGEGRVWRAMARPAKKLRPGEELALEEPGGGTGLVARLIERELDLDGRGEPFWSLELSDPAAPHTPVETLLARAGRMPLPPYIDRARGVDPRDDGDREAYQTVYARRPGAVAAPTAGLHFTPELLAALAARGVERASVTLHVGLGTFRPLTVSDPREHVMHPERYVLPPATAEAVARCRDRGGRVVAVGTTSVRVLETCAADDGRVSPGEGETRLFLKPGDRFRCVDALLTNFHLPQSTLLLLVCAFAGRERVLGLYEEALERGYRFYSYGDAMLFLP